MSNTNGYVYIDELLKYNFRFNNVYTYAYLDFSITLE